MNVRLGFDDRQESVFRDAGLGTAACPLCPLPPLKLRNEGFAAPVKEDAVAN